MLKPGSIAQEQAWKMFKNWASEHLTLLVPYRQIQDPRLGTPEVFDVPGVKFDLPGEVYNLTYPAAFAVPGRLDLHDKEIVEKVRRVGIVLRDNLTRGEGLQPWATIHPLFTEAFIFLYETFSDKAYDFTVWDEYYFKNEDYVNQTIIEFALDLYERYRIVIDEYLKERDYHPSILLEDDTFNEGGDNNG